jgi:hypothetical protein
MLVEVKATGTCVHVDHVTCLGLRLRDAVYGPYHNRACWDLGAQPGDEFVDTGRFRFEARS